MVERLLKSQNSERNIAEENLKSSQNVLKPSSIYAKVSLA